jgi:hypothetical protein
MNGLAMRPDRRDIASLNVGFAHRRQCSIREAFPE